MSYFVYLSLIKSLSTHTTGITGSSYSDLEPGVHAALETYSNVHRGRGQFSMMTTHLFEQARNIVLEYLELNKGKYVVIFCTPRGAEALQPKLKPESYHIVSSLVSPGRVIWANAPDRFEAGTPAIIGVSMPANSF